MMAASTHCWSDQRDCGGERQDEDERALKLAQKEAKRAQARGILDAVGTDA